MRNQPKRSQWRQKLAFAKIEIRRKLACAMGLITLVDAEMHWYSPRCSRCTANFPLKSRSFSKEKTRVSDWYCTSNLIKTSTTLLLEACLLHAIEFNWFGPVLVEGEICRNLTLYKKSGPLSVLQIFPSTNSGCKWIGFPFGRMERLPHSDLTSERDKLLPDHDPMQVRVKQHRLTRKLGCKSQ